MRAVLDPNVIISGLLSPAGNSAGLLRAWQRGEFELIVSDALLEELTRALAYPRLRRRISEADAQAAVEWLRAGALLVPDEPGAPPVRSSDHGDDYLISLAASRQALLVSGDRHLLNLSDRIPVLPPARFIDELAKQ